MHLVVGCNSLFLLGSFILVFVFISSTKHSNLLHRLRHFDENSRIFVIVIVLYYDEN